MHLSLSPANWQLWCLMALVLVLVMAMDSDLRERRVPNVLVLLALAVGVVLNTFGPVNTAAGMLASDPGALGATGALLGALAGLVFFMPMYLLRAMGAGDVKLMAAVGSFAGGVLAVLRMLWVGKSGLVMSNVKTVLQGWSMGLPHSFDAATQSADHLPYALAFAGGVTAYSYWRLSGGAALIAW